MLQQGKNSTEISLAVGIPSSTIRSHVRNHPELYGGKPCRNCGQIMVQPMGRKVKHFCSDRCRMAWWNSHREQVQKICLEVAVSALSSMLGEVLIPIPVLGTIIGNATGMFMYEISKSYLSATEEKLILGYRQQYENYIQHIETEYQALVNQINEEVTIFKTLLALVFDGSQNQRLEASVAVAISAGVQEEKLLKNRAERDAFFIVK